MNTVSGPGASRRPATGKVRRGAALSVLGLLALPGLAATPALADPSPAASTVDYSLAAGNSAGSQVAVHEGVHGSPAQARSLAAGQTLGHDVSGHQGEVDWSTVPGAGGRFTYVKATEGTGYTNPSFGQQYNGAHGAGLTRGAYHFARPEVSGGAAQADYFIANGGGWHKDGMTLPGTLDMEYNPYGDACYGLDQAAMTGWIKDFTARYLARTGRSSLIYTSTAWWKLCTGNAADFGETNPLWLARYAPAIGELPAGWDKQSIWQFATAGDLPGDQNYYNGPFSRVEALAHG